MKKLLTIFLMVLLAWSAGFAAKPQGPDTSAIEENLLEWINKERTARGLAPLQFSPDLRTVAIGHSKDMASRRRLTHLSSTGKSYLDRLVDSGHYFIEIGENVATSETYVGEFIHQGFMDSPEHRGNILNPNFDRIGIGVEYSRDKRYFITQDFLQSLNVLGMDDAEMLIQQEINRTRKKNTLPPLYYPKIANSFARRYALKKAAGQPMMNIANFFGETHIHFIITPELALTDNVSERIVSPTYESGGVGAWFGRLDNYPGGAYLITLFLFPKNPYSDMKENDFVALMLEAINTKRKDSGLDPLRLDGRHSKIASDISRQLKIEETNRFILPESSRRRQILSYTTEDPRIWPVKLEAALTDPSLKRIGIGISFGESKETKKQTFWVTLIF